MEKTKPLCAESAEWFSLQTYRQLLYTLYIFYYIKYLIIDFINLLWNQYNLPNGVFGLYHIVCFCHFC